MVEGGGGGAAHVRVKKEGAKKREGDDRKGTRRLVNTKVVHEGGAGSLYERRRANKG